MQSEFLAVVMSVDTPPFTSIPYTRYAAVIDNRVNSGRSVVSQLCRLKPDERSDSKRRKEAEKRRTSTKPFCPQGSPCTTF